MPRRASSSLMTSLATERANLAQLELDLRNYGDLELSNAVKRAKRELDHPVVTGAVNSFGVNADAVRK